MMGHTEPLDFELVAAAELVARSARSPDACSRHERACPVCAMTLTQTSMAGVTVDVCFAHGTWFDRDEVTRIAEACAARREAPEEASAWQQYGIVETLVRVVVFFLAAFVTRAAVKPELGSGGFTWESGD